MLRGPGSADRPVVCRRRFEPSRVEQQLWSEAYEQVVPPCRPPDATSAGRRQHAANVLPVVSCLAPDLVQERCA